MTKHEDTSTLSGVGSSDVLAPTVLYLNQDWDECCICGCDVAIAPRGPNYGIPMYEGIPVPVEWTGEWGGFTACKMCFDRYEAGGLETW